MKGSWRLARLAGVNIDIHWSFSFIVLWIIIQSMLENRELWDTMLIAVGVLLVFGCVMLHELGHALTALSLNVHVKNIVLLPFGGLAQIQSVSDRPGHEFLIAASGPLVNLVLVIMLAPVLLLSTSPVLLDNFLLSPVTVIDSMVISFFRDNSFVGLVALLMVANAILFVFNLIPAFPMDGGRILRSVLALFFSYTRATQIAILIGFLIAGWLIVVGFQRGSFGLILVAIFIFGAARPAWLK